jgi:hypothetical protein
LHPFSHFIKPKDDNNTKIRLASTGPYFDDALTLGLCTKHKINNKLNFGVYLFEVMRQYSLRASPAVHWRMACTPCFHIQMLN